MTEFFLFVLVAYLFIRGIVVERRHKEGQKESQRLFAALTARVHALEQQAKLEQQIVVHAPASQAAERPTLVATPPVPVIPAAPPRPAVTLPPPVVPPKPVAPRQPETPAAAPHVP